MKKNILDTIGMIIISIVIAVFTLIVGANEKGLRTLPMCILLFIILIYLIIRKIMLKQKIVVKNKIDLFVLLFMCSTILPLIFNTYCTLQGTIEFILKYFFVYAMYLVVRNTIDTTSKVEVLTSVTIISSLIVIILGIDLQHEQYLKPVINKLHLRYASDYRFSSTFGYANTVAIYITFCIFLAIHKLQNNKNKIIKVLNVFYIILGFYIVYITFSRAVLLILSVGLLFYFAIYYYSYIVKNKKKLIIIICIGMAIITTITFILVKVLKYSKPLEINDNFEENLRYPFETNKEYEIKLDISIDDNENNKEVEQNNSKIEIIEQNIYRNETTLANEQLEDFNGSLTFKIIPDSNLLRIKLKITNNNNNKIIINKFYINNVEYILNYKYVPKKIAILLKSFSLREGSIDERIIFYKDCLKIAKNNWLIGQGGNTWKKLSFVIQEYPYNIKESHSYFFELLISYGIVGIILFFAVFLLINIKLVKEYINNTNIKNNKDIEEKQGNKKNKYKFEIILGLDILLLHSLFFDFNMSFLIIILLVFMYIAALMYNFDNYSKNDKKEKYGNLLDYIIFIFLTIIFVILTCASVAKYCVKDETIKKNLSPYNSSYRYSYINLNIMKKQDYKKILEEIQTFMKQEPYFMQNELYSQYMKLIIKNAMNIEDNQLVDYLKFINNQYKTVKISAPMEMDIIMPRVNIMADSYLKLKKMNYSNEKILKQIEEIKQIIQDEYKTNIINIKDRARNGLNQDEINSVITSYEKLLKKIE